MDNKYQEIQICCGYTIDDAVRELQKYKMRGEFVYCVFNGKKLYSDTVTIDNAYLQITGKTKIQFENAIEKERLELIKREEEYKRKIPELTKEWISKGHEILDKKYWDLWDECVPIRLGDLYQGMELKDCLDIVKALNDGCSMDDAKQIIDNQGHSGMSHGLVLAMVKSFCDRGMEFVELFK